jgi:NAD dependent epimerase/dehydratase
VPSPSAQSSSPWAGRSVLVTGAGGFIGSHLAEALVREDASVRAFVRYTSRGDHGWLEASEPEIVREIDIFRGDLANSEAVAGAMGDREVVLHLGALIPIPYSYLHPREFMTANIIGTLNVLEAARRTEVDRIVHTSTSEVYGTATTIPIDEEHRLHPQSPYAATKVGADQLALSYHRSFGTPVVIVRPFNTFGPRQSARAVIPTIITQALSRETIELGATDTTRDFLYVDDNVAGIMRCGTAEGIEGEVINLGTGAEVSIAEVVQRVLGLLQREVPVAVDDNRLRPPDSEVERLVADVTKARSLLGWRPEVDLDEGLRRTIEWLTGSLSEYKSTIYNV